MRGYETVQYFEDSNDRIKELPWDKKKIRIVYEMRKLGMAKFEIEGALDGVVTRSEIQSILVRLQIYMKTGSLNGLVSGRRIQRTSQTSVWSSSN